MKGVVGMRMSLLCCVIIGCSFEAVGSVLPQQALRHSSQDNQSQDVSLLKPEHIAYADAMEFARFLSDRGIHVKSVHRSKLEGFFRDAVKAAFFRTDKGVVEVIFFPDPTGAEKLMVTEQGSAGRYIYSFRGQPHPNPPRDAMNAAYRVYFLMHRNWFIVTSNKELHEALQGALVRN
jgi:hypothetical protein